MKKTMVRPKTAIRQAVALQPAAPTQKEVTGDGEPGAALESLDPAQQARAFEAAAVLFQSGQYQPALELFRQAARGPGREMAHSALLHARMCQRRLESRAPAPRSAEEHYNLAVALVNERRFGAAEEHLRAALAQAPDSDHLYYVMALSRALGGDLAGAYVHMRRAIELWPQNRILARNDPDFAEVGQQPPLAELLYPERSRSG